MASHVTVESRFCRFQVPATWKVLDGTGAVEDRPNGPGCSAVVTECWVDKLTPARELAARQAELAREMLAGFEVVKEEPARAFRFADAWIGTHRTSTSNGGSLLQHQLTVVTGHLACCLTLSGAEPDKPRWSPVFAEIATSFEVPAAASLGQVRRQPLQPAVAPSDDRLGPLSRLQLLVPVPATWSLDEAALTLHDPHGAEITFRAAEPAGIALDQAFATALARLAREPGLRVSAWDQGVLSGDRGWYAIESVQGAARTWGPADERLRRQVLLDDEGVVEVTLHARASDAGSGLVLSRVVAGLRRQPPEERLLRIQEPWVPAVLQGAWRETSPGVFMHLAPPRALVIATRLPSPRGLRALADREAAELRHQPEVALVHRQELVEGVWKGRKALRYSLDYGAQDATAVALRGAWLDAGDTACHLQVRGEDAEATDRLFLNLLEAVEPHRMTGAGRP
jgi:hypothetical protein